MTAAQVRAGSDAPVGFTNREIRYGGQDETPRRPHEARRAGVPCWLCSGPGYRMASPRQWLDRPCPMVVYTCAIEVENLAKLACEGTTIATL